MATKNFDEAKRNKRDEFYTQLVDIENELCHYTNQFKNKVIYCNCDNPCESNFFKYFVINFNSLGIKSLIASFYNKEAYKVVINEVDSDFSNIEYLLRNKKNVLTRLKGDGDFRSEECTELLKQADIVVTNPPFSLFREYVAQLMEYKKKFLIIGNVNALTYKEIFPLIKKNKIWLGESIHSGDREFRVPDYYPLNAAGYRIDEYGHKFIRIKGVRWYTNLDVSIRHQNITLYKKYTPEEYPKYDNYDAIDVSKVAEIPYDYTGAMGVPITFIDKYNPEQFEIIALGIIGSIKFSCEKKMEILKKGQPTGRFTINAKGTLYKKYNPKADKKPPAFKDVKTGELYSSIYARIIVRRIGGTEWK